jgi:hypothetical protein
MLHVVNEPIVSDEHHHRTPRHRIIAPETRNRHRRRLPSSPCPLPPPLTTDRQSPSRATSPATKPSRSPPKTK